MKVFRTGGKVNFVDDNNVFVGYDYESSCCESYFYGFSLDKAVNFDAEDIENEGEFDLEGYNFDTSYFENGHDSSSEEENYAQFKLTSLGHEEWDIYLTLYNSHNGYYSHGFEMCGEGVTLHEGDL